MIGIVTFTVREILIMITIIITIIIIIIILITVVMIISPPFATKRTEDFPMYRRKPEEGTLIRFKNGAIESRIDSRRDFPGNAGRSI